MKNKKNIYILIPVVVLVWGLIGYRIFAGINPSAVEHTKIEQRTVFKPEQLVENRNFTIEANYRDPFLGTLENQYSNKPKKKKIKVKKEEVVFPDIQYKGMFKPGNHGKTVFLIEIDGSQLMFKLKEEHHEVKLLKGDKEQIVVKYKTEKQTYYLKN